MASFGNSNLNNVFSALRNQQKLYFSGCCSGTYPEETEQAINRYMIPRIEELAVEDIMDSGEHNIKHLDPKPELPVLVIDGSIFCNYQTAKKTNVLSSLGCPLDGNYNAIREGKVLLDMISDLCTMSPADFSRKHPVSGEFFNGSARLISMLEKVYKPEDFKENSYSNKLVEGNVRFDNRIKAAVMQFINANENNTARYENSALYYNDTEITVVGAELSFKRNDITEDFVLSKLKLCLFVDHECSRHYPFEIALGSAENIACHSIGKLFTDTTYTRFADKSSDKQTGVWNVPAGTIREKACGGPNDKRNVRQLLNDYECISRKTSNPAFISAVMDHTLSDEDRVLATEINDYDKFMEEWRNAFDFVQYSTLNVAMPNSWRTENFRVVSLLESKEEYIRLFAVLTGGFYARIRSVLSDRANYPEKVTDVISFNDLKSVTGATLYHFRDEANTFIGNRTDMADIITVADIKEAIETTKQMRSKHCISDDTLVSDTFGALFKADKEGAAFTLFEFCKPSYLKTINDPENDMHKFALSIGNYLYYNATMTIGDNAILIPAGRVDYEYDEEEENHKIYIKMALLQPSSTIVMRFNDGKLLRCTNEVFVSRNELYDYEIASQEDIARYIPYPEIRTVIAKYLFT